MDEGIKCRYFNWFKRYNNKYIPSYPVEVNNK